MMTIQDTHNNKILAIDQGHQMTPLQPLKSQQNLGASSQSVNLAIIKKQYQPPLLPHQVPHSQVLTNNRSKNLMNQSQDQLSQRRSQKVDKLPVVEIWKNPLHESEMQGALVPYNGAPSYARGGQKSNLLAAYRGSGTNQSQLEGSGQLVLYSDAKSNATQFTGISPIKNYRDLALQNKNSKHGQKPSNQGLQSDKRMMPLELPPINHAGNLLSGQSSIVENKMYQGAVQAYGNNRDLGHKSKEPKA